VQSRLPARAARAVVAIALITLASACTGDLEPAESSARPSFESLIVAAIEDATASQVDASQLEALERAQAVGEVAPEVFLDARQRALDCMSAAGIHVSDVARSERSGLPLLEATLAAPEGMSDRTMLGIADDCELRFSTILEHVYLQQPSALNAYFDRIESHRTQLIACLREHGATIDDDASMDELFVANEEVNLQEAEKGQPYDCMVEVGAIDM